LLNILFASIFVVGFFAALLFAPWRELIGLGMQALFGLVCVVNSFWLFKVWRFNLGGWVVLGVGLILIITALIAGLG
jgi:hypothetical protein